MFVEIRDKEKPAAKPVAECQASVQHFMSSNYGEVSIPLFNDSVNVGSIVFEIHDEAALDATAVIDKNYPHVKSSCMVCKNTRMNDKGTPYQCRHCVCVKCNGTGINASNKNPCAAIKTM